MMFEIFRILGSRDLQDLHSTSNKKSFTVIHSIHSTSCTRWQHSGLSETGQYAALSVQPWTALCHVCLALSSAMQMLHATVQSCHICHNCHCLE